MSLVFLRVALVVALGLGAAGAAVAKDGSRTQVVAEGVYAAGSPEARDVGRWLNDVGAYQKSPLGAVEVVNSRLILGDVHAYEPGDGPPVPLPPSGNPGQRITVTSSGSGYRESWTYQWINHQWRLISYEWADTHVP